MLKLITLDLDHTLWNPDAALERAEARAYRWLAAQSPEFAKHYNQAEIVNYRRALAKQRPELSFRVSGLRVEAFRQILLQLDYSENEANSLALAAFDEFYQERSKVDFYPYAWQVLENLAQHYPLMALTNGNADLKLIGIDHLFCAHFCAESVGAPKPELLMFELALQQAGVAAHEALHVGDSPEMDIAPAKILGMKTIWANYSAMDWPAELPTADATITAIHQLAERLQRLS